MSDSPERPRLVGDVGGTHTRCASVDREGALSEVRSMACSEYRTLEAAIRDYLRPLEGAARPQEAALAVACPVVGDRIELTNRDWSFSIDELRERLELTRLEVLNDFAALALALPALGDSDCDSVKPGVAEAAAPLAVLGPGTGLGIAALVPRDGGWLVVTTEGGHRDLAPVTDREWEVFCELRRRHGHVSVERVLSGPGLVNLHEAICALEGEQAGAPSAAEVVARAAGENSGAAREAVGLFSAWLGAVAGDLALTFGARGGIYLGGGVLPKMREVFDRDAFVERFVAKGRFQGYVEAIPVQLILSPTATLKGAAEGLRS